MQSTIILLLWMLPVLCHTVDFEVYWYVPTKKCEELGVNFRNIPTTFGIIQNTADDISGDHVVVLDRPGKYPHITYYYEGSERFFREVNGGLPIDIDLTKHLNAIDEYFNNTVDPNFSGRGIINSISDGLPDWRPIFRQNNGARKSYRIISFTFMSGTHDLMDVVEIFEESAKNFMIETLNRVKQLRPYASWTHQDYPTCYEATFETNTSCTEEDKKQNDELLWLWKAQDFFMPRMITQSTDDVDAALNRIGTLTHEIRRIVQENELNKKTFFYFELHAEDDTVFPNKDVIKAVLQYMIHHRSDGVILHDYSRNLDTNEKCQALLTHLRTILGPTVREILQEAAAHLAISDETTSAPEPSTPQSKSSTSAPELFTLPPVIPPNTSTVPPNDFSEESSGENPGHTEKPNKPNFQQTCEPITVIFYVFCFFIIQILA